MNKAPVSLASISNPNYMLLVYGGPGVGKTTFAAGSQQFRTLILDVDSGADAAANNPRTRQDAVDVFPITSQGDFAEAFAYLESHLKEYQLVVVDTATELFRLIVAEVTRKRNLLTPDPQCWGIVLEAIEMIAREFRHLPIHTLWLAHEIEKEDPDTKRMMYRPGFAGQFGERHYSKHFSLVARQVCLDETKKDASGKVIETITHRWLNCERDGQTHAKNRGGVSKWETPDIDTLIGKMISARSRGLESNNNE